MAAIVEVTLVEEQLRMPIGVRMEFKDYCSLLHKFSHGRLKVLAVLMQDISDDGEEIKVWLLSNGLIVHKQEDFYAHITNPKAWDLPKARVYPNGGGRRADVPNLLESRTSGGLSEDSI